MQTTVKLHCPSVTDYGYGVSGSRSVSVYASTFAGRLLIAPTLGGMDRLRQLCSSFMFVAGRHQSTRKVLQNIYTVFLRKRRKRDAKKLYHTLHARL